MNRFLKNHLFKCLGKYEDEGFISKFDTFINKYFKTLHKMDYPEKILIQKKAHHLLTHKLLLDSISKKPLTWSSRYEALKTLNYKQILDNSSIPPYFLDN